MKESSKTNWIGLWEQQRNGIYGSHIIRKADIPAYTKIIMMQNRYFKEGGKRPRYVFCFANGDSAKAITTVTTKQEYYSWEEMQNKIDEYEKRICLTAEQLQSIISALDPDDYYTVSDFVSERGLVTEVHT